LISFFLLFGLVGLQTKELWTADPNKDEIKKLTDEILLRTKPSNHIRARQDPNKSGPLLPCHFRWSSQSTYQLECIPYSSCSLYFKSLLPKAAHTFIDLRITRHLDRCCHKCVLPTFLFTPYLFKSLLIHFPLAEIFTSATEQIEFIRSVIEVLPNANRETLRVVLKLCNTIYKSGSVDNQKFIAPVWGPTLLLRKAIHEFKTDVPDAARLMHLLVKNYDALFVRGSFLFYVEVLLIVGWGGDT